MRSARCSVAACRRCVAGSCGRRRAGRRAPSCAASTGSSASTTPSSTPASTRSRPSCAAPAARRPREACDVLAATALWWRIQLDPDSRALDDEFSAAVDARSRRPKPGRRASRTTPKPGSTLGGAYAARVQWRVLRDEKLAAARDGKRIKQALERAIALDPASTTPTSGSGCTRYYADVAPAAAQGAAVPAAAARRRQDRGAARRCCARARAAAAPGRGRLPAAHHLSLVRAAAPTARSSCSRRCTSTIPATRCSSAQIADIQDSYQHDITASLATWRDAAGGGARAARQRAGARRGAGPARHRAPARGAPPDRPRDRAAARGDRRRSRRRRSASLPLAYLALGEAQDRLGERARRSRPTRSATRRRRRPIRTTCASDAADGCAARRTRRAPRPIGCRSKAGASSRRTTSPAPSRCSRERSSLDPQRSGRALSLGRVLQARKDDAAALAQFESGDPRRARLPAADSRRRLPRSGAPARARRRARDAGDRRTTASPPRCSAPPPTRAPPRRARSPAFARRLAHASALAHVT